MMADDDEDDAGDDDGAEEETSSPAGRVRTRGLGWIVVPAAVGLALGALVGPLAVGTDDRGERVSPWRGALVGGAVGTTLGGAAGAFVWAFFPYRRGRPDQTPDP
jgi:hypothetical protein